MSTSLPIDPRTTDQAAREALAALAATWSALTPDRRDAGVDAVLLLVDHDALAQHQKSRARTGQAPLDVSDPGAVAMATHRAGERAARTDRRHLLPLEAAAAHGSGADDDGADAPATPEVHDTSGMTPEATLIVWGHAAGIVHAAWTLCDAIDAAAQELSQGRRRGSGMRRIQRALKRPGGRPRGAGPGTPAAALRSLLRAGGAP